MISSFSDEDLQHLRQLAIRVGERLKSAISSQLVHRSVSVLRPKAAQAVLSRVSSSAKIFGKRVARMVMRYKFVRGFCRDWCRNIFLFLCFCLKNFFFEKNYFISPIF